eukprot:241169_1
MSAAGEKGTARNLLRIRGNMKKGGDKQCHQECKESKQCPQDKCSICREGQHSWKQCLPVCGEECKDKDDCPAECKECKGGVCSKPDPHCNLGEIKVWHASPLMDQQPFSRVFRRGAFCGGHKTGEVIVGGTCHKGFTRSIRTTVTPGDTNHVACGRFNDATHDVPASKWVVEDSPKSCKLKVPYCEHHCLHSNTCKVQIMEECTNPYE